MKTLNTTEVKSIEQFFQLTQEELLKIMSKFLKSKYNKVFSTKEYVVAVGDIPVGLVAHLDTVFPKPPENIFYDRAKNVMWSPEGLGADDRAGVYSIIQLIKQGFKPTIIFTTDEEKGAIGASKLVQDYPEPIADLKYLIQLDRRGTSDCVFYDCNNHQFEEYVEKFGFVTAFGTFSDISIICPTWDIAGVNLSVGYANEHSYSEILHIGAMLSTIRKVSDMLKDANNEKIEKFKYIPTYKYNYRTAYGYPLDDDEGFGWDPAYGIALSTWKQWHSTHDLLSCELCGIKDYEYNLYPTKTKEETETGTIYLCSDCISKMNNIGWCLFCGEPFILDEDDKLHTMCYDCRDREDINDNCSGSDQKTV